MSKVTESIFSGTKIVPLADVHHIEERGNRSIAVVLTGTTWCSETDDYNNAVHFSGHEATEFKEAWCRYRSELEADTVQEVPRGEPDIPIPTLKDCEHRVVLLARLMQYKLDKNYQKPEEVLNPDGRGRTPERWAGCSAPWLIERMEMEIEEAKEWLRQGGPPEEIALECADIANFAAALAAKVDGFRPLFDRAEETE